MSAHRLAITSTSAALLVLAACGPEAATPDLETALIAGDQVAALAGGDVLLLGGGQTPDDRVEDVRVGRLSAAGQYVYSESLPTGPRDGLETRELRALFGGGALALTVQYDRSALRLPVRSQLIATDVDGRTLWRVELADAAGACEATDVHVLADGSVLVAAGTELQRFRADDGTLLFVDDLGLRLGVTTIEELQPLPSGELAVYAGFERSPDDANLDLDYQVVVLGLEPGGAERWRHDVRERPWKREGLLTAPGGGLAIIDTERFGTDVLPAPPRLTVLEAGGAVRFAVDPGVDVLHVLHGGEHLVTAEVRQLSDGTDEEGRPDDFGYYVTRRDGATGALLAELFLGSTDELEVHDVDLLEDGRVVIVGRGSDRALPLLRVYRLP